MSKTPFLLGVVPLIGRSLSSRSLLLSLVCMLVLDFVSMQHGFSFLAAIFEPFGPRTRPNSVRVRAILLVVVAVVE